MPETSKIIETTYGKEKTKITENKENSEKQHSIEDLNIPKENTVLKDIVDGFSSYIENELKNLGLNKNKLDNIKLTILSDILDKLNGNGEINITKSINDLIKKIPDFLKAKKDEEENKNSAVKTFLESLGLVNIKNIINEKILKIKKEKDKNKFNDLKSSFNSLGLPEKTFGDIQGQINEANKNSNKVSEALDTANEMGFGGVIGEIINYLMKTFPFLASILGAFQGQFEKGGNSEKTKKSVSNLQTFLGKNKDKSPLDKIEGNENFKDKEKLNPKKLESFYKYLDTKNIDYSKETFWEEFLTGKDKNGKNISDKQIIKLRKLIETQDFKNISLEKFIETLNNLGKIEDKKEKEDIIKHNTSIKTKIEKAKKVGKSTTELEKQIKHTFEENLANNKIEVNGKLEDISIINNQIKIGENTYKISINGTGFRSIVGNVFESIKLNGGELTIVANGETVKYGLNKAIPLLKELINNGGIEKKPIPGKPATLTIKKV